MSGQAQTHPLGDAVPRLSTRSVIMIGMALAIAVGGLFAAGTLPRLRRQAGLKQQAQQARSAVPTVQVVRPRMVTDTGLILPSTIQAFRDTVVNARTTGYLSRLYVDIGSHVRAGQVLAEIASPDMDQQLYQAQAQTAQSQAAVTQSVATVAQGEATVSQNQATVTQQQASVQQAYAQVESFGAAVVQSQANEKSAEATLMFKKHALAEAQATLRQQQSQLDLARVNYRRAMGLVSQGFLSQQDADTALTTVKADVANVNQAEAAVRAAQSDVDAAAQAVEASKAAIRSAQANLSASRKNAKAVEGALAAAQATVQATQQSVRASQANVQANQAFVVSNQANTRRFAIMTSFEKVVAPFDGVITSRNVDLGALIVAGGTTASAAGASGMTTTGVTGGGTSSTTSPSTTTPTTGMFGIARTDAVRIDVSVPQSFVPAVSAGSTARVTVREIPNRTFAGTVSLQSGALDANSRTQLVEVILPNRDSVLVPGMYAEVHLMPEHPGVTLRIPNSALLFDAQGTRVESVTPDGRAHFLNVQVGTDYGTEVQIVSGLNANDQLANNPDDTLPDGARVKIAAPPSRGRS